MSYFSIVLGILLIPLVAQLYIKYTYQNFLKQNNKLNISGFEAARKILNANGLEEIHLVETQGYLTDHYDSKRKVIRLSDEVFNNNTISSVSIAAHECGHAIQDNEGYLFMKIRSFLVPIVNVINKIAYIVLIVSIVLELFQLTEIAIILLSSSILFQLITLPVEINASKRAKQQLIKLKILEDGELKNCSKVLGAAALTYIASILASILNLLRLTLLFGNRD